MHFGLFTGQVGYAWNTALLYFKGGAAVVGDRNDIICQQRRPDRNFVRR